LATIPKLGGFGGRAVVLGPQIGFILPLSKDYRGYLNIKHKDLGDRESREHLEHVKG
jgi:hypothetical protein